LLSSKAIEAELRNIMSQLTSRLASQFERGAEDDEADDESIMDLGLTHDLNIRDEIRVDVDRANWIPSKRGVFLLKLGPPLVDSPRLVHFAWAGSSFKLRDYIAGRELYIPGTQSQPEAGFELIPSSMDRDAIWAAAVERIPTDGELYHTAMDFRWWRQKLIEMTEGDKMLKSEKKGVWAKDRIIEMLNLRHQRATYGAIAGIVGGAAQGVMRGRDKLPMNSWVVASTTRKPPKSDELATSEDKIGSRRGWPTG
jgi:hypothetical protein